MQSPKRLHFIIVFQLLSLRNAIAIPAIKHIIISIHFSPIADTNRATSDFFFGFFTFGLAGCVP